MQTVEQLEQLAVFLARKCRVLSQWRGSICGRLECSQMSSMGTGLLKEDLLTLKLFFAELFFKSDFLTDNIFVLIRVVCPDFSKNSIETDKFE